MPTPSRRRWFQFSLRTMFVVVTVFAIWLGWEVKIVQDRKAALQWLRAGNGSYMTAEQRYGIYRTEPPGSGSLPFWRRWMGDGGVLRIYVENGTEDRKDDLRRLFPEARLYPTVTDFLGLLPTPPP